MNAAYSAVAERAILGEKHGEYQQAQAITTVLSDAGDALGDRIVGYLNTANAIEATIVSEVAA